MAFPVHDYIETAKYVAEKKASQPNWGQIAGQGIGGVFTAIGKRKFDDATEERKTANEIRKNAAINYLNGKQFRLPDGTIADAEQTRQAQIEFASNAVRKMKDNNGIIAGVNASGKLVGTWEPIKKNTVSVPVNSENVESLRAAGYAANIGEYAEIPISTSNKIIGEAGQNKRNAASIAGAEKRTGMTVAGAGARTNATIEAGKEKQTNKPVSDSVIIKTYQSLAQELASETNKERKLAIQRDLIKWQPAYVNAQNRAKTGGVSTAPTVLPAQGAGQSPVQQQAAAPTQYDPQTEQAILDNMTHYGKSRDEVITALRAKGLLR